MNIKTILSAITLTSIFLIVGCKKKSDTTIPTPSNSVVIPVQTTVHKTVSLGSAASTLAILANASITNTRYSYYW